MLGQKVAITSPLPQTSRRNQMVVYQGEKGKLIITDTPGVIAKVSDLVGRRVNLEAAKRLSWADILVMVVDISRQKNEEEAKVLGLARKVAVPKILVYNKIDQAVGTKDFLAEYNYLEDEFDKTIAVSALKDKHVKGLINLIFELLPEKANQDLIEEIEILEKSRRGLMGLNSKEFVAELIREKAYLKLRKEVPYSITIEVKELREKKALFIIKAEILTTADRYKKMIIGKNGHKIKQIGMMARKELELMAGKKVFLGLEVKVDKHWPERMVEI